MIESSSQTRRVVVTGLGVVSPIGIGKAAFWQSLVEGCSGIGPISQFPPDQLPVRIAGEVRDFEPKKYIAQRKSIKVMCRDIQLGVAAAQLAMDDAGLEAGKVDPSRIGVDYGADLMLTDPTDLSEPVYTCMDEGQQFHFERWAPEGMRAMFPLWLLKYLPNMPACHIAIFCDARGPNNTLTETEASGNLAIGEAARIIARGSADVMVAGATGSRVHPLGTVQACLIEELSHRNGDPREASRPFDAARDGMVVGEGAGCLILEELRHAQQRGAPIYAEVIGMGSACCALPDGTPQWQKAMRLAMQNALRDAQLQPPQVGHINAHGLGTRLGDVLESKAILEVFGDGGRKVPMIALKSYFGNTGAGCGALELIGTVLALKEKQLPATLNYEAPDPECPLNVVAGAARETELPTALNLNVTRMGQASCAVVRQYESS